MMDRLKSIAEHAVHHAKALGATAADAFIREDETFAVNVRKGEVETLKEAVSRTLRLRIFVGKKTATSQTSDLSAPVVDTLVAETLGLARLTSEDENSGLPDSSLYAKTFPNLDLADSSWNALTTEQRIDLARRAEAAAFAADSSITNSSGGSFESEYSRTVVANTSGFVGAYETTMGYIVSLPIAERDGAMQQDYWLSIARHREKLETPEVVGQQAARRAARRVGARKIKTCDVPVIFDPMTARTLIKHLFDAVSGDAIYRRRSFLVDQLSANVASEFVTVIDDSLIPRGLGSRPFDDEGVQGQKTRVIEQGVLRNYVHSAYTAKRLNATATGNGTRTGSGSIGVGTTNFFVQPGQASSGDIIGSVQSGLYVVELIGSGVNLVNGDYSRGAVGLWIENGKLTYPVHEITIAGNLRQMLQDITMIGDDLMLVGTVASPTLKIRSMTVSGD
jgi:PmbA protein